MYINAGCLGSVEFKSNKEYENCKNLYRVRLRI